ncbi:hypothetical protein D3C72_2210530 [compost metagenome]
MVTGGAAASAGMLMAPRAMTPVRPASQARVRETGMRNVTGSLFLWPGGMSQ